MRSDALPLSDPYPVGTTIITWSASDSSGNTATCEQTVVVTATGPRVIKQSILDELNALLPSVTVKKDRDKLADGIKHLQNSLKPVYWVDDAHLVEPGAYKVFDEEKTTVTRLRELKTNNSGLSATQLQDWIDLLVLADRTLALIAIDDAIAANGNAAKIAKAQDELNKGYQDTVANQPEKAIDHYKNSWKNAVAAY